MQVLSYREVALRRKFLVPGTDAPTIRLPSFPPTLLETRMDLPLQTVTEYLR